MKILFIGNSHTFMNDMPALVRDMVREVTGEECECVMLAYGGRSLKWHMSECKNKQCSEVASQREYRHPLISERSLYPSPFLGKTYISTCFH